QGVADALAEHEVNKSRNGDDSHDLGSDKRRTIGHDVAYAMTWKTLKKMMTDKYCPMGKIKKLEIELRMFPKESDEVKKYGDGLPDMIQGSVMASKPKKMQKFKDTSRNNQNQQQPFKRHNVARAYTAGLEEKKPYKGSKPLCLKCNYHHDGQYAPKCTNCKRTDHLTRDCRS
ncbi:hypothetical protein Tco_0124773, partial [Tanacetum coccineum]